MIFIDRYFTDYSSITKLRQFNDWLSSIPSKQRILIGGNHDTIIEKLGQSKTQEILSNATYLLNSSILCDQISIWGCPLSEGESGNISFQSNEFKEDVYNKIPSKIDILLTHGQCADLETKIKHKIHIWGHAHNAYGIRFPGTKLRGNDIISLSICASSMDGSYNLTHLPIIIDIPRNPDLIDIPIHSDTQSNNSMNSGRFFLSDDLQQNYVKKSMAHKKHKHKNLLRNLFKFRKNGNEKISPENNNVLEFK